WAIWTAFLSFRKRPRRKRSAWPSRKQERKKWSARPSKAACPPLKPSGNTACCDRAALLSGRNGPRPAGIRSGPEPNACGGARLPHDAPLHAYTRNNIIAGCVSGSFSIGEDSGKQRTTAATGDAGNDEDGLPCGRACDRIGAKREGNGMSAGNLRVALLQMNIRMGDPDANFAEMERWLERAAEGPEKPDIIVVPEMWNTGYAMDRIRELADHEGRRTRELIADFCRKHRIH